MPQTLAEFLREKKARADSEMAGVDWGQRRDEWIAALAAMYDDVFRWLHDPSGQGIVSLGRRPKRITEPHLGTYTVDELLLEVGDEELVLSPIGRNVYGAQGRVDVRGETGEAMLVAQPGGRWSVVTGRTPQLRLVPLTEETFGEVLRAVMRK